jgi:hypothetical protein
MVKYTHRSGGGGAPIVTTSPIYQYGVDNGCPEPPMTDSFPSDRWTGMLQKPKGEKPRYYDDSTPPKYSESGAQYPFKPGKSATPSVTAPRGAKSPYDRGVPKGIPERNRFAQGFSYLGSGSGGGKGRRGKSG